MRTQVAMISSMATREILAELATAFEQKSACQVVVLSLGGVDAAQRIRDGGAFDVAVLAAEALARLAEEGHVITESVAAFAASPTALAVRAGAPRPDQCDEASVKALVSKCRAVGLSSGPSGTQVRTLLQSWGLRDGQGLRIVQASPGVPVAQLISDDSVDVGFQQLSELLGQPGIDIVGAVPASILPMTTFSMGICRQSTNRAGAQSVIASCVSPEAAPTKRRFGMDAG